MADEFVMTHEGVREAEAKLEYLKTVKRRECAEQIKIARAFGDLSENAEYDEAKNEQARVELEIMNLERMLKHAVVVDTQNADTDTANIGTCVHVLDLEFDEDDKYFIVGSSEADVAKNRISNESPVGRALIGKKAGDVVEVEAPSGVISLKILEITR